MPPIEQARIEMLLQLFDLEGNGRLRHEQHLSSLGKRQLLGYRMKHLKPPIGHKTSPHPN
jgi:hypothetical protein